MQQVIPLWKEVEYYKEYQKKLKAYLGIKKAQKLLSEALYLISIGTNDFLENYFTLPNRQSQFTVKQYEDFLIDLAADFLTKLYVLGARKISLAGLPPMGCLPLERTTNIMGQHSCVEELNNVALDFDGKLRGLVAGLNEELQGIDLVYGDVFYIFLQIITRPSVFGKFLTCINSSSGFQVFGKFCASTTLNSTEKIIDFDVYVLAYQTSKFF